MMRDYLLESTNWGADTVSFRAIGRAARRALRVAWIAIDTLTATVLPK